MRRAGVTRAKAQGCRGQRPPGRWTTSQADTRLVRAIESLREEGLELVHVQPAFCEGQLRAQAIRRCAGGLCARDLEELFPSRGYERYCRYLAAACVDVLSHRLEAKDDPRPPRASLSSFRRVSGYERFVSRHCDFI